MAKLIITYPIFQIHEEKTILMFLTGIVSSQTLCISFATYKSIPNAIAVLSGVVFNSISKSKPRSTSESFNSSAISID